MGYKSKLINMKKQLCRFKYRIFDELKMMKEDNALKPSFRERTHAEKMRAIGIEPPEHVPKRFKTAWDQLVHDFPCSPELQHKVWDQ